MHDWGWTVSSLRLEGARGGVGARAGGTEGVGGGGLGGAGERVEENAFVCLLVLFV